MARLLRAFDRAVEVAAGGCAAFLLVVVLSGILARGINRPLSFTDELSGVLMVWLACLGWIIATRRRAHIRIRVVLDKLGDRPYRAVEVTLQLAVALFGAVVAWRALHLIETNWDIEAVTLPLSMAWLFAPLVPAGLVAALQALADLRAPRPEAASLDATVL
jgi:TRAP-type transport system small permease protein